MIKKLGIAAVLLAMGFGFVFGQEQEELQLNDVELVVSAPQFAMQPSNGLFGIQDRVRGRGSLDVTLDVNMGVFELNSFNFSNELARPPTEATSYTCNVNKLRIKN